MGASSGEVLSGWLRSPGLVRPARMGRGGGPRAEQHLQAKARIVENGLELEGKGSAFDTAGLVRILPQQIIFFAHRPEKPRGPDPAEFQPGGRSNRGAGQSGGQRAAIAAKIRTSQGSG